MGRYRLAGELLSAVASRHRMSLAGKIIDIPVKGTHAHSWIMAFDEEDDSFDAFAEVMPQNCIFLIDTYDTIEGVNKAIGSEEDAYKGIEMIGVRLDSGRSCPFEHRDPEAY